MMFSVNSRMLCSKWIETVMEVLWSCMRVKGDLRLWLIDIDLCICTKYYVILIFLTRTISSKLNITKYYVKLIWYRIACVLCFQSLRFVNDSMKLHDTVNITLKSVRFKTLGVIYIYIYMINDAFNRNGITQTNLCQMFVSHTSNVMRETYFSAHSPLNCKSN